MDAFGIQEGDLQEVADEIYGASEALDTGRVTARPISIMQIRPDLAQPRRGIPAPIRGDWMGDPAQVGAVLAHWRRQVEDRLGEIDLTEALSEWSDGPDVEHDALSIPFVAEYVDLVGLAGSILRDGLTNPITVASSGNGYIIETGERRWLAHHLLVSAGHEQYGRVAARVVEWSVWRQAAENGARRPLNAIGMARQIARLLMALYGDPFKSYEDMVTPGGSDRPYYAQVADGVTYRIPRGQGQRILDVTGLKSRAQISHYRNLLSIDDDLWLQADAENWTEYAIREAWAEMQGRRKQPPPVVQNRGDMFTAVNIADQKQAPPPSTREMPTLREPEIDRPAKHDSMPPAPAREREPMDEEAQRFQVEAGAPSLPFIADSVDARMYVVTLREVLQRRGRTQEANALGWLLELRPEHLRTMNREDIHAAFESVAEVIGFAQSLVNGELESLWEYVTGSMGDE